MDLLKQEYEIVAFEVPLSAGLRWERVLFQSLFGTVSDSHPGYC